MFDWNSLIIYKSPFEWKLSLKKRGIYRENMEEIGIIICLKKKKKLKKYQKNYREANRN